jgi:hypothetical protein
MAGANSNIQITDLDFNLIKNNMKTFLQGQTVLQDYNFDGSALSTLLDVLAYNTQYNAFYLNMVANEMFLDTAIQRNSVISHAKLLDYTPKSNVAPTATINLNVYGVTDSSLTLPQFTSFLSEAIDGVNYNFVTTDSYTVNTNTTTKTATFLNIPIKQGLPTKQQFTVSVADNPNFLFEIPDPAVDTTTLLVTVQQSSSNASYQTFSLATSYLTLTGSDNVYFLQAGLDGLYQIYFGDGILGTLLSDGNVVNISYITTQGTAAAGANSFVLMDTVSGYSNTFVYSVVPATQGSNAENIDSIKFQAPKAYAAQGRAVTVEDYITAIQENTLGFSVDAVNVWGGAQSIPPVYGQVFISVKPTGGYLLTALQKQQLISEVIQPISVLTVTPNIVDPDYVYLKISTDVIYNPNKTTNTANNLSNIILNNVNNYAATKLNSFNSTFSATDIILTIQNSDASIITNQVSVQLQKKFYPNLTNSQSYTLNYGTALKKGIVFSGITSSPSITVTTTSGNQSSVYIQEVPSTSSGIDSITLLNAGFNYLYPPIVTIIGDGIGATAVTTIAGGSISGIKVTNAGSGYTTAYAIITNAPGDNSGSLGAVTVTLQGQYGTLALYQVNTTSGKTLITNNIGTVDYENGIITLNNFSPISVNNLLGQLTITATPVSTLIPSSFNRIITVDAFDPTAITVNVTQATS